MFPAACTERSRTSYENECCVSYRYDSTVIAFPDRWHALLSYYRRLLRRAKSCITSYVMWDRVDSHAQRRGRNTITYAASIAPLFLEFHCSIASQRLRLVSYTGVLSPASSADADATHASAETLSRPVSRLFALITVLKF